MKRLFHGAVAALALAGCVTVYNPTTAVAWVKCEGARCDALFRQAQAWIAVNAGYRVRLVTDTLIETYGPNDPHLHRVAYTIVKEPARIVIRGSCAPIDGGCTYDPAIGTNELMRTLAASN